MASTEELIPKLRELIVERLFLSIEPGEMDPDKVLMEEYSVDSVSLFEIVVGLEEEFGIVLDDDEFDIETFQTVRSIAEFAAAKLEG